ncbi:MULTISPECIES: EF-hand domain-containing protein [unclassified Novosphingobium]|uniref:EF-hand domain-containing protein n=1 Tax=unclassified Novosphingobium TaxID=2644732 RepID=UPI00146CAB2A|nr:MULTISPECIES: EF-hand domain-containing protein [unclassified Novosphingobium]NMN85482.1 hypothetical protein [Novosphingobium sp. SG916]
MRTLMILLAAVAMPAAALAQDAGPGMGAPRQSAGTLTRDAFMARQTARIMAADADGDGRISRAEMAAAAQGKRDPGPLFDRMDTNKDGYLDKDEIQHALAARFDRMDRNGDGVLTPDERMHGRASGGDGANADAGGQAPSQ